MLSQLSSQLSSLLTHDNLVETLDAKKKRLANKRRRGNYALVREKEKADHDSILKTLHSLSTPQKLKTKRFRALRNIAGDALRVEAKEHDEEKDCHTAITKLSEGSSKAIDDEKYLAVTANNMIKRSEELSMEEWYENVMSKDEYEALMSNATLYPCQTCNKRCPTSSAACMCCRTTNTSFTSLGEAFDNENTFTLRFDATEIVLDFTSLRKQEAC